MLRCELAPEPPIRLHYSKTVTNLRTTVLCKTIKQWSGRMVVCHVPWVKMILTVDHTHFQIFSSGTPKLICDAQMSSELLPFWTMLCIMHMALLFLTTTDSLWHACYLTSGHFKFWFYPIYSLLCTQFEMSCTFKTQQTH